METINLRFTYTEEEFISATRFYMMRSTDFILRLVIFTLYCIACIGLLAWLELSSVILQLFVVALFIPFVLAFAFLFIVPRARYRSDPKYKDEYALQFSEDGIHFKTTQVDALLQWSLYTKVLENERFYILIYGKHMISVLPKRAFPDSHQFTAFKQLLERKIPAHLESKFVKGRKQAETENSYVPPAEPPDWR
jgi:hypothetical protein